MLTRYAEAGLGVGYNPETTMGDVAAVIKGMKRGWDPRAKRTSLPSLLSINSVRGLEVGIYGMNIELC